MKQLLAGNGAIALGAYHAGIKVAAAYPGTPSTEIMEYIAQYPDIHAEWATNEKVAMEVGLGASYAGVRSLVSMKHVGFNVAVDPFMAAATTGVDGGLVVVCADDPGSHSSQNEQDSRHYSKLAKVPMIEASDSNEAYHLIREAFLISEQFDTPVIFRSSTRISHSKTLAEIENSYVKPQVNAEFKHNIPKYVMLPVYARLRHPMIESRIEKLADFAETFKFNYIEKGNNSLGIITSGISYQYAKEVFPDASLLKLGMTFPLPRNLINSFSKKVKQLIVIEELDPFLQENILAMGISVTGKEFIPRVGELNANIVREGAISAGLLPSMSKSKRTIVPANLPGRPPLLCPGCPHAALFFVLSAFGNRSKILDAEGKGTEKSKMIITGDIGCYSLAAYPPLRAMDTIACMGAGIGQAIGMEKAGVSNRVVAVIGDSTFLHSGITGLINAVYNNCKITIVILDNNTTAMTGHQGHPGTGVSAQGNTTSAVDIELLVKGMGINDVKVVNAFDVKGIRSAARDSIDKPELSVVIVRGPCAVLNKKRSGLRTISKDICNGCETCLRVGCSAIQKKGEKPFIDISLCVGDACSICEQICPQKAIEPISESAGR